MRFVLLLTIILITACSKAPESTSVPSQQQDIRAADPPAVGRYVNMEDPLIKEYIVSGVVPAHAETSINRLAEVLFVGMYFASNEKRLFVPMPHTSTSFIGLPSTVKSNAIAVAFDGN